MRYLLLLCVALMIAACETTTPELPTRIPATDVDTVVPTITSPAITTAAAIPTENRTPIPSNTPPFIPRTNALEPSQQAFLRLIHAVPELPAVDIYVEARAMVFNLTYGLFTQPTGIEAGDYTLRVQPAGTRLHEVTPLIEQTITISGNESLTLLLTGSTNTPEILAFLESNAPLNSNESRLNVVHAVPDGPQITLQQNGESLTGQLTYGQLSNPVILPSEPVALLIENDGTVFENITLNLQPHQDYYLIIIPDTEATGSTSAIQYSKRVPGRSQLRFVNSLQIPVDLYLDGEPFTSNIAAGQTSERVIVPTGIYTAEAYPAGTQTDLLGTIQFNMNQDDTTALILIGNTEETQLIRHDEVISPVPLRDTRIAFVNGYPGSRGVRVELPGGAVPGIPDLSYGQSSPPALLSAGTDNFFWTIYRGETQGETLEVGENVTLQPGWSYLYIMRGGSPLILGEPVGEDADLIADTAGEPTQIPTTPFRIRFVNAIARPVQLDILVDGMQVTNGLNTGQVSEQTIFLEPSPAEGSNLLAVDTAAPENAIASSSFTFTEGLNYTVYTFGESQEDAQFIVLQNPIYTPNNLYGNIRLVNTSADSSASFRLSYREASIPITAPQPSGTLENDELPPFRAVMQAGMTSLTEDIIPEAVSRTISIPVGQHNLFVVDVDDVLIAATIPNFTITANTQYDVIVYQGRQSEQVSAYVVAYPVP